MPHIELATRIDAAVEVCFDLSLDVEVHLRSTTAHEEIVGGVRTGRMGLGDEVTWKARHFGLPFRLTSRITEYERPSRFVDEQIRGPFGQWHHEHRFTGDARETVMVDIVDCRSPLGPVGALVDRLVLERYMMRFLMTRNAVIRAEAEQSG